MERVFTASFKHSEKTEYICSHSLLSWATMWRQSLMVKHEAPIS